ncbi:DUF3077 domain-containing protein [Pseudomonas sp. BP8]|uniref:DUF3077 domain-containing protein n=1 Tax=Pseudomonas sp. BP8 TaxID=2817864 RepID=UPI001AE1F63E|nr:DUF3077 domain-containing protein [Pseudomonas sp. BP8]MBP2263067.1 hypothetical protein [Pseudomonas sp. BP8]HDS1736893.1 DUF3077 domain-containing protein [Pseudomonas putida]
MKTSCTVGETVLYHGENRTQPLLRIEFGIPCERDREQASELMDYARDLTTDGLIEGKPAFNWASNIYARWVKLLDDTELGVMR